MASERGNHRYIYLFCISATPSMSPVGAKIDGVEELISPLNSPKLLDTTNLRSDCR